jgi:hypothetical protein
MRRRAEPKPRRVSYELLPPKAPEYKLLTRLVRGHHEDLTDARIALAWAKAWKADVDGRLKLGACKRASDLDRELADYDFIVLLNRSFWQDIGVSDHQRAALLDHELTHAALVHDKRGEPVEDERGRKVYRLRRHDLEEFNAIAERYGLWKRDLEAFAVALRKSKQQELPIPATTAAVGGTAHTH